MVSLALKFCMNHMQRKGESGYKQRYTQSHFLRDSNRQSLKDRLPNTIAREVQLS